MAKSLKLEQRQKILNKAPNYFAYTINWINACVHLTEAPRQLPLLIGSAGTWEDKCSFSRDRDVYVLKFRDAYRRIGGDKLDRAFKFDFRRVGSPVEIFRFDTHGRFQDSSLPCHVHNGGGNDVRIQEDDPILNGYSMKWLTLCDVIILIENYLEKEKLPWL